MTTLKDQLLITALVTALGGGLLFCGFLIPTKQTPAETVNPSSEESADPSSQDPIVQVQSKDFFRNLKAPYIAPATDPNTIDPNTLTNPNMQ